MGSSVGRGDMGTTSPRAETGWGGCLSPPSALAGGFLLPGAPLAAERDGASPLHASHLPSAPATGTPPGCAQGARSGCAGGTPHAKPRGRGQGRIKASREKSQLHAPSRERGGKPPRPHAVRPSPSLAPTPRHIRGTPDPSGRGTGASPGGLGSSLRAPGLRGALGLFRLGINPAFL